MRGECKQRVRLGGWRHFCSSFGRGFWRSAWSLGMLVASLLLAGVAAAQPVQITDGRGRVLRLPAPPQRIVSLLPSLSESVCALGKCALLVGVDRYSNWPQELTRLPQVGGGLDPNIEAIVALHPDVVLASVSSRANERLEALGLTVVALEPKTHAQVRQVLGVLGDLLGIPPAQGTERLWREIDAGVQAAAQSLPASARGARVYFEVSRGPYAASESSFIGETLQRLRVGNVVPAALGPFPRLNPEYVVRANPDVIMLGNRSMQARALYPGWDSIPAVRAQRVCVFDAATSELIVRPGPRLAEGARAMARCLAEKLGGKGQ